MAEKISAKAKRELRKLAKFVAKLPEAAFNMNNWIYTRGEDGRYRVTGKLCETDISKNICRTACCLAGWTVINAGLCMDHNAGVYKSKRANAKQIGDAPAVAQKLLGLTDRQAFDLFYPSQWPREFCNYENNFNPSREDAVARIKRLIDTGE